MASEANELAELVAAVEAVAHEFASVLEGLALRFVELGEPGPASALTVVSAALGDLPHRLESRLPRAARHSQEGGSVNGGSGVFDQ